VTFSRIHDALLAGLVAAAVLAAVLIFGDALYIGARYYLTVSLIAYSVGAGFRPQPLFQFGISLGIAITSVGFLSVN